ncbi:hypothetical protein [Lysobacter hankyongensis]|uniref:Lipoprotein n=1 Tax=Lysobacter hankyongensis TaxID=1176535 RepID=A0ABP9CA36_9GAMM
MKFHMISDSIRHPLPARFTALLSLCFALSACERGSTSVATPTPATSAAASATAVAETVVLPDAEPSPSSPIDEKPVRAALDAFVASPRGWDVFGRLAGVTWHQTEPVPAPGAYGAEDTRTRTGKLPWTDTATRPSDVASEDQAGITLIGRESVESVAFRKFRPSTDYEAAIRAQLGDDVRLKLIADRCARVYGTRRANRRGTAFYELHLGPAAPIYMEGNADSDTGKLGPGYTTYEFTRIRPDARIADMGCVSH